MNGRVTTAILNMRSYPSLRGNVIATLSQDALVEILGQRNEWLELKHGDGSAFVHGDYVERIGSVKNLKGRVRASILNVRAEPAIYGAVIGTLSQNSLVNIVSESGDWYEIKFNNSPGYIHKDYVDTIEGAVLRKGVVNTSNLNVRKSPETGAEKIGTLTRDAAVEILSQVGKWYEIKFNNTTAFIHSDYVDITTEEPDARYFYQKTLLREIKLEPEQKLKDEGSKEEKRVARTWNQFGNLLQHLSASVDIDVGCALAVLCVESAGHGFDDKGRMVIRFENHQFWKWWGKYHPDIFNGHFAYSEDEVWKGHTFREDSTKKGEKFHGDQTQEWKVLDFARTLNDTAALKSISMGAPQIMGFNHEMIGYESVQRMFNNFSKDIRYHIFGLFDFIDNNMLHALKNYDFVKFARFYNGPGQAQIYGGWIQDYYEVFKREPITQ